MKEILLKIGGQKFQVKKDLLCEHSDYFRAMFSGNYVENNQNEILIEVVDANSMKIIIQYMEIGLIDLSDYTLATISDLAIAANFLQITELVKQIEYILEIQISTSNWMETMCIAENSSFSRLEQLSAAFGLLSFKSMKPDNIPSIQKLFWYLSHPYLDARSELEVFKFGLQWISNAEIGTDALMLILCCLDLKRLSNEDVIKIKKLLINYVNSLTERVVDCLHNLIVSNCELTPTVIANQRTNICEKFTERVYIEVYDLVNSSIKRTFELVPTVPIWTVKESKPELAPHHLFTFTKEFGFEKWLEIAEKNLWGWSITSWGSTRLVVVCGEHGRGTGIFMKDIKVYDTLKKEWIQHGVQLPPRRHGGLTVVGDSLYIIGGVGGFRVVLETALIYDLKQRTFRKIANLPDAIQNPAVCTHEDSVYAAGHNNIYRYEDNGQTDTWTKVVGTDIRMSCMVSFKGYVYCTQNYFSHLYRFKPNVDAKLQLIAGFTNPPAAICNLGDKLQFFTRTMCGQSDMLAVEEYTGKGNDEKPKVVWSQTDTELKVNDVAGSCSLVLTMPPIHCEMAHYHKQYIARYAENT